jgi:hypothetical protein
MGVGLIPFARIMFGTRQTSLDIRRKYVNVHEILKSFN